MLKEILRDHAQSKVESETGSRGEPGIVATPASYGEVQQPAARYS